MADKLAKRTNDATAISLHLKEQKREWVLEQIAVLAEAYATPITTERLMIYATDLAEFSKVALAIAIGRARRECKFFPQIAEIIERIPPNSEIENRKTEIDRIDELKRRQEAGEKFYTMAEFFEMVRSSAAEAADTKRMPE